jgi:hypothetical protein
MMYYIKAIIRYCYFALYYTSPFAFTRRFFMHIDAECAEAIRRAEQNVGDALGPEPTVVGGPFRGLRYPAQASWGSAFLPKLLGTYERELHEAIERVVRRPYRLVVDIGAAEGYYAVGFALRMSQAPVIAFEIDAAARAMLTRVIEHNGVQGRVAVAQCCDGAQLLDLAQRGPGFLLSDCEGCEFELFQPAQVLALSEWDLLIETHDSLRQNITRQLAARFRRTHRVTLIKPHQRTAADFPLRGAFSRFERLAAMDEGRHRAKWLLLESTSRWTSRLAAHTGVVHVHE